ncbi:MAG TPA: hypothetical protein PLK34_00545 [Candidatus Pacearchaeota archaeon]|nr:hypothetical protein [Candidatus Pacearchaeota archaeon]
MTNKTLDNLATRIKSISPLDASVAALTITAATVAGTEVMKNGSSYLNSALMVLPTFAQMIAGAGRELVNSNRDLTNSEEYKYLSKREKSAIHSADIMYGFAKWGAIGCAEALAGYYLVAPVLEKIL